MSFLDYKKNQYSQNGEDGVLAQIFRLLGIRYGTFFEFGAADGVWCCNTRLLLQTGWKGLYVEPDRVNFERLLHNTSAFRPLVCRNEYVEPSGPLTIENHWRRAFDELGESELDFLSIDVDGFDDELLESIQTLRPKVIMIEVNSGHHPMYPHRIPRTISANNVGQSMYIMTQIASEKGYLPICYTGNLIFVHESVADPLLQFVKSLEELYRDYWVRLDNDAKLHLKKTFIDTNGLYNGFTFDTSFMKEVWNLR
jgi:hypothetical protein